MVIKEYKTNAFIKKSLVLLFSLSLLSVNCSTVKLSEEEFKNSIKKIVVIPFNISSSAENYEATKGITFSFYSYLVYNTIENSDSNRALNYFKEFFNENGKYFDDCVVNVFTNGKFQFETVISDPIEYDSEDEITETTINGLLKKYNADAVYFHYLSETASYSKSLAKGDGTLFYNSIVMGKNGKIYYKKQYKLIKHYKHSNSPDDFILAPKDLSKYFNSKYVSYLMLGGIRPEIIPDSESKSPFLIDFMNK